MKNVDLQKIIYMNTLIANQRTGTPKQFAKKLDLSRSSLFEYLTFLRKDLLLDIFYNCYKQSYYYGENDFCKLMGEECCNSCRKFKKLQQEAL